MSFRLLLASVLVLPLLQGADWKSLKPQGYVSDFSGVIDPASKSNLEQYAGEVERSTGAQMAFVTVNTLDGDSIENAANDLFHAWGIGQKHQDNGILFLLVTADRQSRLEIGNGLEPILPDGLDGMLLLQMRPALRAGQYGEALLEAARRIGEIIAKDKGVTIQTQIPPPQTHDQPGDSLPWPFILGGILLVFFFLRNAGMGRNFWSGLLLGNLLSGGGRRGGGNMSSGNWGGGFGGSDSGGGGFGGFGGGDSGGGGASSSW